MQNGFPLSPYHLWGSFSYKFEASYFQSSDTQTFSIHFPI